MKTVEERLDKLTDEGLLDRMANHNPQCRSTWGIHKPSARSISLNILYFTVAKQKTPWWNIKRRVALQSRINYYVAIGLSHGYFKPRIEDNL